MLVASAIAYTMTLAALHVLWILTGAAPWIAAFTSLISVFFVLATGLSVVLSLAARSYFGPSDPLRQAWTLLVVASAVRLTGHIIRHVLGHTTLAEAPTAAFLAHLGQVVAGPLHTVLVAAALARVMYVCWRLRMLVRPAALDVVLGGATILFTVRLLFDLSQWYAARMPLTALDVLGWTSDPLLALLLIEAIVLRRAAVAMGAGMVARVWGTFATAIFLTTIGDLGVWAEAHQYLRWPMTSLVWYVWPAVEAAWAMGPAWQVIACRAAEQHAIVDLSSGRPSRSGAIAFDGHPGSIDITPGPA